MNNDFLFSDRAHAKLNLHLQVLNRRNDNYHNIFSIMAELEIHDLLKLEAFDVRQNGLPLTVDIINSGGNYSPVIEDIPPEKNLISIAVKKHLSDAGYGGYLRFSIEKNIPSGAGLGGGSSDAACALKLVCRAMNREPGTSLYAAAEFTGSDVPFFISGGVAFAEGRGEVLQKIDSFIDYPVVLINNGIHVNTGSAYGALNRSAEPELSGFDFEINKKEIGRSFPELYKWKELFVNDFEEAVFKIHPVLKDLKTALYSSGAEFALMTGSGSTVYGVFRDELIAESAASELEKKGNSVIVTKLSAK